MREFGTNMLDGLTFAKNGFCCIPLDLRPYTT
jgi:hypothetical protein